MECGMTRRGITLVEVMVVTGILSLLIAVCASGTRQVIGTSRSTKCRANLRQLHLPLVMPGTSASGRLIR